MKKFGRILSALIWFLSQTFPAFATDTPVIAGSTNHPSNTVTNYSAPSGFLVWGTTEAAARSLQPVAGTYTGLLISTDTDPTPGTYTFKVYKNGVATTMTCPLSPGVLTCSDTTHPFSVAQGDTVSIESVVASSPTSLVAIRVGLAFSSTVAGESPIMGGSSAALNANIVEAYTVQGLTAPGSGTETGAAGVMPTGGNISELWADLQTAPGGSDTFSFTLKKNGVNQLLTTTITGAATANHDNTHSISFAAGDTLSLRVQGSATAVASFGRWGFKWVATTDGETIQLYSSLGTVASNATGYQLTNGNSLTNATETNRQGVVPLACTAKKLFIVTANAPGVASLANTVRINGSSTGAPNCPITGGTTKVCSDTSTTLAVTAGQKIDLQQTSVGTITNGTSGYGLVLATTTLTPTPTATPSPTPTNTPTNTPTVTPTPTPGATNTPTPTPAVTNTPTPTPNVSWNPTLMYRYLKKRR